MCVFVETGVLANHCASQGITPCKSKLKKLTTKRETLTIAQKHRQLKILGFCLRVPFFEFLPDFPKIPRPSGPGQTGHRGGTRSGVFSVKIELGVPRTTFEMGPEGFPPHTPSVEVISNGRVPTG